PAALSEGRGKTPGGSVEAHHSASPSGVMGTGATPTVASTNTITARTRRAKGMRHLLEGAPGGGGPREARAPPPPAGGRPPAVNPPPRKLAHGLPVPRLVRKSPGNPAA